MKMRMRKSNLFFIGKGFTKIIDGIVLVSTLGFYRWNLEEMYINSKLWKYDQL